MNPANLNRPPTADEKRRIQAYYRSHPEFFFKYFLGIEAWEKQVEIAYSIIDNRVTSVRSCHSAGKSFIAACIALWYISAFPESIVVTTAPTWRQVKDILWRNINTRYAKALIPLGGNTPNITGWEVATNWFAVGVSSTDPDKIQGYHADSGNLLAICDEAAGIDEPIFEGIDAILTGSKCRKLEIGNPTSSSGTFRDNHKPGSTAKKIKISVYDTPNFRVNNIRNDDELIEAIRAHKRGDRQLTEAADYLVGVEWVYERLKKWGRNSPLYQARVLAEFPDVGENNLIPLSWVEAACSNERLETLLGLRLNHPNILDVGEAKFEAIEKENDRLRREALIEYKAHHNEVKGVDVARMGSDSTVITPRWGRVIGQQRSYHRENTMQTAGRVWAELRNMPTELVGVDVIGVGGGVVDRLHELQEEQNALFNQQWSQIIGVNVAERPTEIPEGMPMMEFANKRAEMYWTLRSWFESGEIYIEPDADGNPPDDLLAELSAIEYKFLGGKIYMEEKREMKKRLNGASPDHADSLMLTLIRNQNEEYNIADDLAAPEHASPHDDDDDEPEPADIDDDGIAAYDPTSVW